MTGVNDADVLIVGAGPVGLLIAHELAHAGVRARIIDHRERATRHSKANVLWPRSLELLARLNLAEPLLRQAHQIERVGFTQRGHPPQIHDLAELTDTEFPFALTLPQPDIEFLCEQRLHQFRVHVERGTEFLDASQEATGVLATLRQADGTPEYGRFAWVIGADGSKSRVRECAGIAFVGEVVPVDYTLVDAVAQGIAADQGSYYFDSQRSLAIAPIGADLFRFATSNLSPEEGSVRLAIQHLLDSFEISGRIGTVRYRAGFRSETRQAATYRAGRVLLAGDAAHVGTPASGQGMNTGIQDAIALGWRLGRVLLGHLGETSLDDYARERRAHVDTVLALTRAQTARVDEHGEDGREAPTLPNLRQLAQLDTEYGAGHVRVPPLPASAAHRRASIDGTSPTVLLYPGSVYSAAQWQRTVLRVRAETPGYFRVVDLAGIAGGLGFRAVIGPARTALIVRPDQHIDQRLDPDAIRMNSFTQLGWRR
ncbi:FAD-dependent monooxygenase [Mycetocola sp. BIGb0189]|uniref:FAD-dependent monooxygenase n=1 Tax=Mycetocola sp. BIGb0189 TaxID=2940604 RepID=UPI0021672AA0|nr:FAD-dependent monooxygenase [Mycetocola sp. BIGb0189]